MERSRIASAFPPVDDERGVAAVFVGLLLVVLIGFGAFALDTSRIYNEHSELQNGADAAALAVARDCAMGHCDGFYDALGVAEAYADPNMRDGSALVEDIVVDLVENTVAVRTATEDTPGDNHFDMVLAQVIGYDGLTVRADAEVAWGSTSEIRTLPLIFSICEWGNFGSPVPVPEGFLHPPESVVDGFDYPSRYVTIYFHGQGEGSGPGETDCHPNPSGQDLPGGFGWLDASGSECEAFVKRGEWSALDPGSAPTSECSPGDLSSLVNTVAGIPYFDKTSAEADDLKKGGGAGAAYRVYGIGALYITGYNFAGQYSQKSTITGKPVCKGELRCIEGYMIYDYVLPGSGIGGPDMGSITLEMRQ